MSEEPLSKNAQKKALKAQQNAQKKAEKDAAKKQQQASHPSTTSKAATDDEELDPTQYYANRVRALAELEAAGTNPYPHKFHTSISLPDYIKSFGTLENGNRNEVKPVLASNVLHSIH